MIHRIGTAALLSGLSAQILKVIIDFARTRKLNLLVFFNNGGMPSSHTSLVTTLATGVGLSAGFGSTIFSVTLIFSMYFIFEAAGLRQEVGSQARVLNELVDELRTTHSISRDRLKELVGHTWGEVLAGFLYGLGISWLMFR